MLFDVYFEVMCIVYLERTTTSAKVVKLHDKKKTFEERFHCAGASVRLEKADWVHDLWGETETTAGGEEEIGGEENILA